MRCHKPDGTYELPQCGGPLAPVEARAGHQVGWRCRFCGDSFTVDDKRVTKANNVADVNR
jgi:hypothetical protein